MKTVAPMRTLLLAGAAFAETPYERDQREQLEKAEREGKLSPDVVQRLRWEREWRQQHPRQPMPNPGQMQKLHQGEIIANTNAGFARMRAQLRHECQMVRSHQEQANARNHVTWTPAQWQPWDRQYDRAQRQKAEDYKRGVEQAGEINRMEREHDEQQRTCNAQH